MYLRCSKSKHWKQAPDELKQSVIRRCIIDGEPVKSISEEIGYSPSLIYKWLRCYREKGFTSHMKNTNANLNPEDITSIPDLSKYDTIFLGYPIWAQDVP